MIRRAALHPVFANLLMFAIIGIGLFSFLTLDRETFPAFSLDRIQITVVYEGASPEDVENAICVKIEDAIEGIEGIKKIESFSMDGVGVVIAHLEPEVEDARTVLDDIKTEVDRLEFPDKADEPVVSELKALLPVIQVAIHGDVGERNLKELAEEVRNEILQLPDVTQVEVFGTRKYQIQIQVSDQDLERLGLRFDQVVARIRQESLTLPAGSIRTENGEINVRTVGERKTAREFEEIVVVSRPDGSQIRLGQIARIVDTFEEEVVRGRYNGDPSVQVQVFRTNDEDLFTIAREVREYVAAKKEGLPEAVELDVWLDFAPLLDDRLDLLFENMAQGLVLVFLILLLFLGFRLSFWVTLGIPTSFLGAMAILSWWGGTVNMQSAFAFIIVLGLLVDDAIVIAENVAVHYARGASPLRAAIEGTREVASSVLASAATTVAAFAPSYFVEGDLGKIMKVTPVVVVGALVVSLVEGLLILPNHLAHSFPRERKKEEDGRFARFRKGFDRLFDTVTVRCFGPIAAFAVRFKGITIGVGFAAVAVMAGLVLGGQVEFVILPSVDSDYLRCRFELPKGTPIARTQAVADRVERSILAIHERNGSDLVRDVSTAVGAQTGFGFEAQKGSHVGEVVLTLKPGKDGRSLTAQEILDLWRAEVGDVPDAERFSFGIVDIVPMGKPIEIRLIGDDVPDLRRAAADLKEELATYPGVVDISDDDRKGKLEYEYSLKPQAAAQNVSLSDLAGQLRQGLFGEESVTIQRGREDVEVLVLFPESERQHVGDLDDVKIRTPSGESVPVDLVAERKLHRGVASIIRINKNRAVTVSAEISETTTNSERVVQDLERNYLGGFLERHPDVRYELAGQRGQSIDSVLSLMEGLCVGMGVIYVILALTFRSFVQPLIIMFTIPIAYFGGVAGHWLLGYDLSLQSLAGFVGLTGIVVNDSIVLVEFVNDALARGTSLTASLLESARSRFRPIFLTSVTTILGLLPMLAETSGQAKFLIPMAVAIAFGVMFETAFVLFLIPAAISVVNDARRWAHWLHRGGPFPTPEELEPAVRRAREIEEEETGPTEPAVVHEIKEQIAKIAPMADPAVPARVAPAPAALDSEREGDPPFAPKSVTGVYRRCSNVETLAQDASRLEEGEDLQAALVHYQAALRHDRTRSDLHFAVGLLRMRMDDPKGAAASFDRAVQLEPDNLDYREYRGWARMQAGDYEAAIPDFTARLETEPENLMALKGRGTAHLVLGRVEPALADLSAAVDAAPSLPDLRLLRANARYDKKDFAGALEDYDRAVAAQPRHARARLQRGRCREAVGRVASALEDYEVACDLEPELHEALFRRARARLELGQYAEAIEDLSELLAIEPGRTVAFLHRGKARSALGDADGAVRDFQKYLEHNPRSKIRRSLERYIREHTRSAAR